MSGPTTAGLERLRFTGTPLFFDTPGERPLLSCSMSETSQSFGSDLCWFPRNSNPFARNVSFRFNRSYFVVFLEVPRAVLLSDGLEIDFPMSSNVKFFNFYFLYNFSNVCCDSEDFSYKLSETIFCFRCRSQLSGPNDRFTVR